MHDTPIADEILSVRQDNPRQASAAELLTGLATGQNYTGNGSLADKRDAEERRYAALDFAIRIAELEVTRGGCINVQDEAEKIVKWLQTGAPE